MKHCPRPDEQDDLLRPRLVDMIDQRHELVKLAALIDSEVFEREWVGFFPSGKGGLPPTEWTGLIVSASWVSGLWGRRFPVRAGYTPAHCVA
jgi:hypothetical protein